MTTVLDKTLKRQISVDGVDYTVAIDPNGLRLIGKGKWLPEVELRWSICSVARRHWQWL